MKKRSQTRILNFLLIILVVFGIFAFCMAWNTQQTYEDDTAAAVADYDYDMIQDMVDVLETFAQPEEYAPYVTEDMLRINADFKGWLWIPETHVNYPVVQSDDNNTYLYRSFQGQYSSYGSLFLDQDSVFGAQNRVIHGHNMGNNRTEMFSCLVNYQDPEWAGERLYAYFTEPDSMEDDLYELFAVLNFDINDLDEFNYLQTEFETEDDFHSFIEYLKSKSLYETDFYPTRDTLILSTCNRAKGGADNRLLVCFGHVYVSEP